MVFQRIAGGLRARSTELIHFLSSHPVDLICIRESNLNLSSSFWIPGFFALRSDRTHSRYGILSPDPTHVGGGVIIFFRQGPSFSELSTSSLSLLDPYSKYVRVNIFLNNSSSLSSSMFMFPLFAFFRRIAEPTPFLSSSFLQKCPYSGGLQLSLLPLGLKSYSDRLGLKSYSDPRGKEVFDWVISSDLLLSMTLIYLLFSIAPPLTSPLLPPLSPCLAPRWYFRTWVLITFQFH